MIIEVIYQPFDSNKCEIYCLIFKLNENNIISVITPVGLTDQCDMGEGVSQGSVEGTSISAASE